MSTRLALSWLTSSAVLALAAACGSSGGSSATDAANTADTGSKTDTSAAAAKCEAKVIGDHGVGKPCTKPDDCFGQPAVTCATDLGAGAPSMCVENCFGLPGECAGGVCMTRGGKKPAVCVPVACAAQYSVVLPSDVTCSLECTAAPTDLGVGKPCAAQKDCENQKAAKTCPVVIKAGNPKYCSMLCSEDADCGAGAVCWRRKVEEQGVQFMLGSCANAACCKKP